MNGATNISRSRTFEEVAKYSAYALVGLILLLTNATIILIVSRHRTLRAKKEYIILAGTQIIIYLVKLKHLFFTAAGRTKS
jgi:uncharacterized membrane protein (GlpM family)